MGTIMSPNVFGSKGVQADNDHITLRVQMGASIKQPVDLLPYKESCTCLFSHFHVSNLDQKMKPTTTMPMTTTLTTMGLLHSISEMSAILNLGNVCVHSTGQKITRIHTW